MLVYLFALTFFMNKNNKLVQTHQSILMYIYLNVANTKYISDSDMLYESENLVYDLPVKSQFDEFRRVKNSKKKINNDTKKEAINSDMQCRNSSIETKEISDIQNPDDEQLKIDSQTIVDNKLFDKSNVSEINTNNLKIEIIPTTKEITKKKKQNHLYTPLAESDHDQNLSTVTVEKNDVLNIPDTVESSNHKSYNKKNEASEVSDIKVLLNESLQQNKRFGRYNDVIFEQTYFFAAKNKTEQMQKIIKIASKYFSSFYRKKITYFTITGNSILFYDVSKKNVQKFKFTKISEAKNKDRNLIEIRILNKSSLFSSSNQKDTKTDDNKNSKKECRTRRIKGYNTKGNANKFRRQTTTEIKANERNLRLYSARKIKIIYKNDRPEMIQIHRYHTYYDQRFLIRRYMRNTKYKSRFLHFIFNKKQKKTTKAYYNNIHKIVKNTARNNFSHFKLMNKKDAHIRTKCMRIFLHVTPLLLWIIDNDIGYNEKLKNKMHYIKKQSNKLSNLYLKASQSLDTHTFLNFKCKTAMEVFENAINDFEEEVNKNKELKVKTEKLQNLIKKYKKINKINKNTQNTKRFLKQYRIMCKITNVDDKNLLLIQNSIIRKINSGYNQCIKDTIYKTSSKKTNDKEQNCLDQNLIDQTIHLKSKSVSLSNELISLAHICKKNNETFGKKHIKTFKNELNRTLSSLKNTVNGFKISETKLNDNVIQFYYKIAILISQLEIPTHETYKLMSKIIDNLNAMGITIFDCEYLLHNMNNKLTKDAYYYEMTNKLKIFLNKKFGKTYSNVLLEFYEKNGRWNENLYS